MEGKRRKKGRGREIYNKKSPHVYFSSIRVKQWVFCPLVSIYYYDHYLRNSIVCFHNACLFDFPFATRMYDFPNSQQTEKNPTPHAHILVNPTSREAVKSRFLSRYFVFFRIPLCILVKSQIPKIPFPNPVLRVTLSKSAYVFDVLLKY